jgi:flagellar hook-length control protein FliK
MDTRILEMTKEATSNSKSRKRGPSEIGDFAQVLNFQEIRSPAQSRLTNMKERQSFGLNSEDPSLHAQPEKTKENPFQDQSTAADSRPDNSSRSGGEAKEPKEKGLSPVSESGQTRQAGSETGVDGRENGVQPGSSTEATVNAPSHPEGSSPEAPPVQSGPVAAGSDSQGSTDSAQTTPDEFQQLIQELVAASDPKPGSAGKPELTISAKMVEKKSAVTAQTLNLPDQKIIFETGLAQHFVRLLTDQFDSGKNGDASSSEGTAVQTVLPPVSGPFSATDQAKSVGTAAPLSPQLSVTGDDASESMNRILQVIRSNIGRRQSQITVQLDPPELGRLRMDIKLIDNNLNLAITTDNQEARQIILNRMETLRTNLEQNGITLGKVEVLTRSPNSHPSQNQNWQDQQSSNSGQSFAQQHQSGSNPFREEGKTDTHFESDNETNINPVTVPILQTPSKALNMVA